MDVVYLGRKHSLSTLFWFSGGKGKMKGSRWADDEGWRTHEIRWLAVGDQEEETRE